MIELSDKHVFFIDVSPCSIFLSFLGHHPVEAMFKQGCLFNLCSGRRQSLLSLSLSSFSSLDGGKSAFSSEALTQASFGPQKHGLKAF